MNCKAVQLGCKKDKCKSAKVQSQIIRLQEGGAKSKVFLGACLSGSVTRSRLWAVVRCGTCAALAFGGRFHADYRSHPFFLPCSVTTTEICLPFRMTYILRKYPRVSHGEEQGSGRERCGARSVFKARLLHNYF